MGLLLGSVDGVNRYKSSYWKATYDADYSNNIVPISVDGPSYLTASSDRLYKVDRIGNFVWGWNHYGYTYGAWNLDVDNSENVYYFSSYGGVLHKFNSAGTIQYSKYFDTYFSNAYSVSAHPTNGEVFVCDDGGSPNAAYVAKVNSNGTMGWSKKGDSAEASTYIGIVYDNAFCGVTNQVYAVGYRTTSGGQYGFVTAFSASTGNVVWQKEFDHNNSKYINCFGVATDPTTGDVYVTGTYYNSYHYVMKFNSSGTRQWARGLYSSSVNTNAYFQSIDVQDSNNIYMGYWRFGFSNTGSGYVKFDSAGNFGFIRYFDNATSGARRLHAATDGTIGLAGDFGAAKLDGSGGTGTGTYNGFTYSGTSIAGLTWATMGTGTGFNDITESTANITWSNLGETTSNFTSGIASVANYDSRTIGYIG